MNPLFQSFVGTIIRAGLLWLGGWASKHGIFTDSQVGMYVEAGTLFAVPFLWALWNQYKNRIKFLTALMPGPTTEAEVNAHIAAKLPTPTVFTPANTIPGVPIYGPAAPTPPVI